MRSFLRWLLAAVLRRRPATYTIRYDRVTPEGELGGEVRLTGLLSLDDARRIYANQCAEYAQIGYRTANDCIVGPQGEVYATEGPTDEA